MNLQIVKFGGANQTIEFFIFGLSPADIIDSGEIIPGDAIVGHAALPGVISTAAINADEPGNDAIAAYSSPGPSTVEFPAHSVRATPTITGIDNVTVSNAWGGPVPFPGTSAAAPHIAGIAALMLEANPALTPSEVKATLESTAADRGAAGFDNTYGAGLANALSAVNAVLVPDLIVSALTASTTGQPGGTVTASAEVKNQGPAASGAFQVAFYFSLDGILDAGDARSATTCGYASLGAGVTNSAGCNGVAVSIPGALTPESYTVFAKVDDLNAVAESNESNNSRASGSGTLTLGEAGSVSQNGFESGALLPWKVFGGASAQVKAGAARTGSFGVEISGGSAFGGVYQDISGLTPGQSYEVAAWVRSPAGSGAASLWVHDATGGNIVPLLAAPGAATYQRIKLDYLANATGKLRVHLVYNGALGTVEWDDISVVAKSAIEFGFESGALPPWNVFGGATAQVKAGAAHTGVFGVEISGGGGFAGVFRDVSGLTPGQNYEVTAWVRSPAGSGAASLWVHDGTGGNIVPLLPAPGAATYRRMKLDYLANATGKLRVHLVYNGAPGTVEWDDISVVAKNAMEFGFESGALPPWNVFGGATAQVKAGAAHTGVFGVEISGGGGFAGVFQDVSGLTPGQNYEVTAWVRSPAGSGAASLWVHDGTGGNIVPLLPAPGAATYRRIKLDYRANATGKVRIHLVYNGAPGTAEWDDIVVLAKNAIEFGFESGALPPWKKFGATSTTATPGAARTGSFGLELSGADGGLFFDLKDLTPGATYEASVWVRGGGGTAYLWLHDTTSSNWATTIAVTTGAYQLIKVNYTANATGKARIHLRVSGSPGSIEWDDVSFGPL